jgi:hypothetical protein
MSDNNGWISVKTSKDYLPPYYAPISEPAYRGAGEHSVAELEFISMEYKKLVHQLRVEIQAREEERRQMESALNHAMPQP